MEREIGAPGSGAKSRAAHLDEVLDEALEETFLASDPIAVNLEQSDVFQVASVNGV